MDTTEQNAQQQYRTPLESGSPITPSLHSQYSYVSGSSIPQKRSPDGAIVRQKTKVTRACDTCKAKKAKCSGEQPCESCNRRGLQCQYEAAYSRGKAPTPRRIERASNLQPYVQEAGPDSQRISVAPVYPHQILSNASETSRPDSFTPRMNGLPSIASRLNETEPTHNVSSRSSPGLEVAGQYSDPTSGHSFLHRAWRRISNNDSSQILNGQLASTEDDQLLSCAGDKPFLDKGQVQVPSLERGHELLKLYFDVCIATYRLLHRPTVESWLVTVSENARLNRPLYFELGRAKASAILSVLAIASFHEDKARGSSAFSAINEGKLRVESDELFCESVRLAEAETGIPRLESAQSRLIQVLYLLMSCRFNQAWYTFGHTLQIISALGLHRRDDRKWPSTSRKHDYIEEQCRKRIFWVAYILDKYLGVVFGRPRHYHDDDIDQDFPDRVNDQDMTSSGPVVRHADDCHIDALIYHAKLSQISERILREVYTIKSVSDTVRLTAAHRLGLELRAWKASLPPLLGSINPSSLIPSFRRQANMLKLSYCHAVMLAHRPFLLKNTMHNNDEMRSLAKDGLAECISASQAILDAVDRIAREGPLFHAFWFTHYVTFCALVVVYVWTIQESSNSTTRDERRNILDQAERCLHHLAQATASNSPSRKYSIILQELRNEAKRKTAKPAQAQSHSMDIPNTTTMSNGHQVTASLDTPQGDSMQEEDAATRDWQPLFDSPTDSAIPGLQNFLDVWQTTDWLHLDSSAFGPFSDFDNASLTWMNNVS
ncbi:Nn.00g083740.m01.CDS01 [Neocucurbitaria sp. VM-36]